MPMLTLVTGGAGRLGIEIVKLIASLGNDIRVFDLPLASWYSIQNMDGVEVFPGDITRLEDVHKAVD